MTRLRAGRVGVRMHRALLSMPFRGCTVRVCEQRDTEKGCAVYIVAFGHIATACAVGGWAKAHAGVPRPRRTRPCAKRRRASYEEERAHMSDAYAATHPNSCNTPALQRHDQCANMCNQARSKCTGPKVQALLQHRLATCRGQGALRPWLHARARPKPSLPRA